MDTKIPTIPRHIVGSTLQKTNFIALYQMQKHQKTIGFKGVLKSGDCSQRRRIE